MLFMSKHWQDPFIPSNVLAPLCVCVRTGMGETCKRIVQFFFGSGLIRSFFRFWLTLGVLMFGPISATLENLFFWVGLIWSGLIRVASLV